MCIPKKLMLSVSDHNQQGERRKKHPGKKKNDTYFLHNIVQRVSQNPANGTAGANSLEGTE